MLLNVGSGGGAAAAAPTGGAAAGGATADAPAEKEEEKEEGTSYGVVTATHGLVSILTDCIQRRKSPTRTWDSVCSIRGSTVSIFLCGSRYISKVQELHLFNLQSTFSWVMRSSSVSFPIHT